MVLTILINSISNNEDDIKEKHLSKLFTKGKLMNWTKCLN